MTRKRHMEELFIVVLKDAQEGIEVQELRRKHGISNAMYKWRAKCRAPGEGPTLF
jgi:transposase-like protein